MDLPAHDGELHRRAALGGAVGERLGRGHVREAGRHPPPLRPGARVPDAVLIGGGIYSCRMATEDATDLDVLADRIGRVIRAHRLAQGMSLGDLARASGLSKTILARIESGAGNPSVETLWRVSRALTLPLGALLAEDEAPRVRAIPPARARR